MESITPHAFSMKPMWDRIAIRHHVMRAVKRGVETGYLRKGRKVGQKRADRCQVMRLMKWGQRDEPLQLGHDAVVDQHRPIIARTAMDDAMADSNRADAKLVPQPIARDTHRGRNV